MSLTLIIRQLFLLIKKDNNDLTKCPYLKVDISVKPKDGEKASMVPCSLEIDGIFIKLSKKKLLRMNNPEYMYLLKNQDLDKLTFQGTSLESLDLRGKIPPFTGLMMQRVEEFQRWVISAKAH